MTAGPPLNGIDAVFRELESLRRDVEALKRDNGRNMSMGNTFRIQVSGTGGTALLQAVRVADGLVTQLAP